MTSQHKGEMLLFRIIALWLPSACDLVERYKLLLNISTNPVDLQGFAVTFLRHLCAFPNSNPVGCCFAQLLCCARKREKVTRQFHCLKQKQGLGAASMTVSTLFQQYFPILGAILPEKHEKASLVLMEQKRFLSWCAGNGT